MYLQSALKLEDFHRQQNDPRFFQEKWLTSRHKSFKVMPRMKVRSCLIRKRKLTSKWSLFKLLSYYFYFFDESNIKHFNKSIFLLKV